MRGKQEAFFLSSFLPLFSYNGTLLRLQTGKKSTQKYNHNHQNANDRFGIKKQLPAGSCF